MTHSVYSTVAISLYLWVCLDYQPVLGTMHLVISGILATSAVCACQQGKPSGSRFWSLDEPMFQNGARIVDIWTSPTLPPPDVALYPSKMTNPYVDMLVGYGRGPVATPEVALNLYLDRRALWFFAGHHATLTAALPNPVRIEKIRLRGYPARRCLPRDVNVWGLVSPRGYNISSIDFHWPASDLPTELQRKATFPTTILQRRFMGLHPSWIPLMQVHNLPLGDHSHDIPVDEIVTANGLAVHAVSLEFRRNWGNVYSCFAGLGVSGNIE